MNESTHLDSKVFCQQVEQVAHPLKFVHIRKCSTD